MSMPSKAQVSTEVLRLVSTHTTLGPGQLKGDYTLKGIPLLFDNISLMFLAESLRGYVKQYDENATVKTGEVRKSGLTVDGLVQMIQKKVGAV